MRRALTIGGLLVLLVVGAVAAAEPSAQFDNWQQKFVTNGRNIGEVEGYTRMYWHPSSNLTWTSSVTRVADSRGTPIATANDLGGGRNDRGQSSSGTKLFGPNTDAGCFDHGTAGVVLNQADYGSPGSVNYEAYLISKSADPGLYEFKWVTSAGTQSIQRWWNKFPQAYSCIIHVQDPQGRAIAGCAVNALKPWTSALGSTDIAGNVYVDLPAQEYQVQLSCSGYQGVAPYFVIADNPAATSLQRATLYMAAIGQPAAPAEGHLHVQVNDSQTSAPIAGASVTVNGRAYTTDSNGTALVTTATQATFSVAVSATGYTSQVISQFVGGAGSLVVSLVRSSDPGGGGGGGGTPTGGFPLDASWWQNLFNSLFVPQQSTCQAWQAQIGAMTSWGPFGAVKSFWDGWQGGGWFPLELTWDLSFQPYGTATAPWSTRIDLRPTRGWNESAYADGTRGGWLGDAVRNFRFLETALLWGAVLIALFHWLRPKLEF